MRTSRQIVLTVGAGLLLAVVLSIVEGIVLYRRWIEVWIRDAVPW